VITNQIFGVILNWPAVFGAGGTAERVLTPQKRLFLRKILRGLASERTDGDDNVSIST